jgi:hypothetical protein
VCTYKRSHIYTWVWVLKIPNPEKKKTKSTSRENKEYTGPPENEHHLSEEKRRAARKGGKKYAHTAPRPPRHINLSGPIKNMFHFSLIKGEGVPGFLCI